MGRMVVRDEDGKHFDNRYYESRGTERRPRILDERAFGAAGADERSGWWQAMGLQ